MMRGCHDEGDTATGGVIYEMHSHHDDVLCITITLSKSDAAYFSSPSLCLPVFCRLRTVNTAIIHYRTLMSDFFDTKLDYTLTVSTVYIVE